MPIDHAMREMIVGLLRNELSPAYYYHNVDHTLYVAQVAVEIGKEMNCSSDQLDLLETAALWHDAGLTQVYYDHEEAGCALVNKYLPDFGYSSLQIQQINRMIMATKLPQRPFSLMEEIVADADLEYLGTALAQERADDLYRELKQRDPSLTREAWNTQQINFLSAHNYFTQFCKENREPLKQEYLKELLEKNEKT